MLTKFLLVLALALLLLPACSLAEKSGVLVIVDGMGSSYIYPDKSPTCIDGSPLPLAHLDVVGNASERYNLWVPTPETESGNAVIATGYSGADEDMMTAYDGTFYDVLREDGYLTMAILETGDNAIMVTKPDIIAHDQNNSIYSPDVVVRVNNESVPSGIRDFLQSGSLSPQAAGTDRAVACRDYDEWPVDRAVALVQYMSQAYPGLNYLLVIDVGGVDMSAHEEGFDSYRSEIEDLNGALDSLADTCQNAGDFMMVTADHGMSFKTPDSKGSHASGAASERNESRLAPLLILDGGPGNRTGTYGQECLAPTLLSLLECPNTLSMSDGTPVPTGKSPYLYLISDEPVAVSVDGKNYAWQGTVNGTGRIGPLSAGEYAVSGPSWTKTVALDGDVTIRLAGAAPAVAQGTGWLPYAGAAALSAAGIVIALRLVKKG